MKNIFAYYFCRTSLLLLICFLNNTSQAAATPTIVIDEAPLANVIFSAEVGTQQKPYPYYYLDAHSFPPLGEVNIVLNESSGSFTISKSGIEGTFGTALNFVAVDGRLSETIYVKYEPTASGNHTATISHSGDGAETKFLTLKGNATDATVMPIELVSFRADAAQNSAVLTWVTASEQDNSHFDVESTKDLNQGFRIIGKVDSKNNNSAIFTKYSFRYPLNHSAGTSYFRLKQVDLDGTYTYSKVVALDAPVIISNTDINIAPNPIVPYSKLKFTTAEPGILRVKVLNMNGSELYSQSHTVSTGDNNIALDFYDKIKSGTYILTTEFNNSLNRTKLLKD